MKVNVLVPLASHNVIEHETKYPRCPECSERCHGCEFCGWVFCCSKCDSCHEGLLDKNESSQD